MFLIYHKTNSVTLQYTYKMTSVLQTLYVPTMHLSNINACTLFWVLFGIFPQAGLPHRTDCLAQMGNKGKMSFQGHNDKLQNVNQT